ncbi:MAG TPA: TetR family transcriptional regulator [Planctomycetota bacterium]|nr:TetR family transcriptional regulator [Planctomycetota bacterium]
MAAGKRRTEPASARAQATRDAILAAAMEEFAARGPDGARVDRIATRARANKERIYAYFGGKERLWAAVLERAFAEIAEAERPLAETGMDGDNRLAERALRVYFDIHENHPHLWRLLAWANLTGSVGGKFANAKVAVYAGLEEAFATAQRNGLYSADVTFPAYAFALIALSLVAFSNRRTLATHLDLDLDDVAVRRRLVEELATLIERGAAKPKSKAK